MNLFAYSITLTMSDKTRRFWSGAGDITLNGNTYEGTTVVTPTGEEAMLMSIEAPDSTAGDLGQRCAFKLAVVRESIRRVVSQDLGPIECDVSWYYSTNGTTWTEFDSFSGSLSNTSYSNGVLTAEIAGFYEDIDRGSVEYWTHNEQKSKFPDDDFFENLESLNKEINITWD